MRLLGSVDDELVVVNVVLAISSLSLHNHRHHQDHVWQVPFLSATLASTEGLVVIASVVWAIVEAVVVAEVAAIDEGVSVVKTVACVRRRLRTDFVQP